MLVRPQRPADRIICGLDLPDIARAAELGAALAPHLGLLKLGLELFSAAGPDGYRQVARHAPVFLDLKLHDIPNTVAAAVTALLPLRPAMLTLHAVGGAAMLEAARRAADAAGEDRPILLAVTVLTSMDEAALAATGVPGGIEPQVLRLARMAMAAGADGLVCSPLEVAPLRDALGGGPCLVVPGVRPAGHAPGDQARIATPGEAVAAGADWIVLGRPITRAADPVAATRAIAAGLA